MPTSGTYPRFAWAIRPDASTLDIQATVNGVVAVVTLAAGPYYWRGDATVGDTAERLRAALATHPQAPVVAVALTAAGRVSVAMDLAFTIHWTAGATTADPVWFGATPLADWVGVVAGPLWVYTSALQVGHAWFPGEWYDDDSGSEAGYQVARSETLGGRVDVYRWSARAVRQIAVSFLPGSKVFSSEAAQSEAFDLLHAAAAAGEPIQWTPDVVAAPGVYALWHVADEGWLSGWPMTRPIDRFARYSVSIPLIGYVP